MNHIDNLINRLIINDISALSKEEKESLEFKEGELYFDNDFQDALSNEVVAMMEEKYNAVAERAAALEESMKTLGSSTLQSFE